MNELQINKIENESEVKKSIDLDTILVKEIGQFGKFQLRTLVLGLIVSMFMAISSEYVFSAARIKTRYLIPECECDEPEWLPSWLPNAIPFASSGSHDSCQRYANMSMLSRQVESDTCPSSLFNRNILQPCERYVYENNRSIVYDFELACDEWRRSLVGTVSMIGTLFALPITGYISDRWGRRIAITLNSFNTAWLGLSRYWINTYNGFLAFKISETAFGSGGYSGVCILLMEQVGPKYRVAVIAAIGSAFALGQVIIGLVAWLTPNWRIMTLILYAPQLLTLAYFWLLSESVRWYMSKDNFEKSEALLKKVAKINGKELSDKSLKALRQNAEEEALKIENSKEEPWLITQVFQHKQILLRCIISPIWWITMTVIYYGLSINAVNMTGNEYINYIAVSAAEISGYWTSIYLLKKLGRKPVMIGFYWICGVCQIVYIFLPSGMYVASLIVYLIAKYALTIAATALYVYTAELYPTKYRHSLFAFSSMMGRIGSIVSPLTPALAEQWFEELPFVLFSCLSLLSGALAFFTPETLNTSLPDTFEEAVNIGLRDKKSRK